MLPAEDHDTGKKTLTETPIKVQGQKKEKSSGQKGRAQGLYVRGTLCKVIEPNPWTRTRRKRQK